MDEATETLSRHVSPDGQLTLIVEWVQEADGSLIIVGLLEGDGWHFHPTEQEALRIVDEVLADRLVIMEWSNGDRREFELMDDLDFEIGQGADGTTYRFRLWSREVSFEDLADGKVPYTPLRNLYTSWRVRG